MDPKNGSAGWDRAKEKYWMPVDQYIGGAEHAVLHLLYARFWHKVLYDAGCVSTKEPFQRLFNQGLILAFAYQDARKALVPTDQVEEKDGKSVRRGTGEELTQIVAKMSKSLRNVVNPDDVVAQYGADTLRLYEVFMGPLDCAKPWNPRDIVGVNRFLHRAWRLVAGDEAAEREGKVPPHLQADGPADPGIDRALHVCIKEATSDIENMAFNTAVSELMKFVNAAGAAPGKMTKSQAEKFVLVLSPFAPHIAEELWSRLGHGRSLANEPWPQFDPEKIRDDTIEIPV
jgi:leucyl-tRNA synthetase